jgi:hypothetical protein
MTLFHFLTMLSGVGFVTAILAGWKSGGFGILVGLMVGLVVGSIFFMGMHLGGRRALWWIKSLDVNGPSRHGALLLSWLLFLVSIIWISTSGLVGIVATKFIIKIIIG